MGVLRRHRTVLILLALGLLSLAAYTWAEWRFFIDQSFAHGSAPQGFWSSQHLHDWLYNAASNWQSELIFGAVVVLVLSKHAPADDQEAD